MFGFAKQELEKEINRLNDRLDILKRKQDTVNNRIFAISDYQHLKYELKSNSIEALLYMIFSIGLITTINITFIPIVAQYCTAVCSLILLSIILSDVRKAFSAKKEMNKNFQKCLAISKIVFEDANRVELANKLNDVHSNRNVLNSKLLKEVNKVLLSQKDIINYNIRSKSIDRNSLYDALQEIQNYEDTNKRYFNGSGLIFSQPETLEDYKKMLQQYRKFIEIEQSTFEEPTSYSDFGYNSNWGYKEGPKTKLLKKKI